MANIPGLDLLKDAFKKFAQKHGNEDMANRATRSLAAGAQAAIDKGIKEFDQPYLKNIVTDFFATLASQEVADGVSQAVRSFDEEKVKEQLDKLMLKIQEPDVSLKIATQIKNALGKYSTEQIEQGIDQALSSRSDGEQMIVKALFEQFKPMIDGMRSGTVDEVAEQVRDFAATVPTDAIAMQVASLTRSVTPEVVAKQSQDLVGKLPSPKAVAEIAHDLGAIASEKLGKISKATNVKEGVKEALSEFVTEAKTKVQEKVANDNAAKESTAVKPDSKRDPKKGKGKNHSF